MIKQLLNKLANLFTTEQKQPKKPTFPDDTLEIRQIHYNPKHANSLQYAIEYNLPLTFSGLVKISSFSKTELPVEVYYTDGICSMVDFNGLPMHHEYMITDAVEKLIKKLSYSMQMGSPVSLPVRFKLYQDYS